MLDVAMSRPSDALLLMLQGTCKRGELCPFAHGVFEAWLHPARYRTQACRDGAACGRPICFFAHRYILQIFDATSYTMTHCCNQRLAISKCGCREITHGKPPAHGQLNATSSDPPPSPAASLHQNNCARRLCPPTCVTS